MKILSRAHTLRAGVKTLSRSDFAKKVGETVITRFMVVFISLVMSVVIARVLGPEGRGFFAAASALTAILAQFGNLGLHSANTYYLARDHSLLARLMSNSLLVAVVLGGGLALIVGLVFTIWPGSAPVHGTLLLLALLLVPMQVASLLLANLLVGLYRLRAYNTIELTTRGVSLILLLVVIAVNALTVEIVFGTGVLAVIFNLGIISYKLRHHITRLALPSITLLRQHIGYGLRGYIASFFSFLVLRSDILIIQYKLGAEELGYYSLAVTIIDMMYIIPVNIGFVLFPKLTSMTDNEGRWLAFRRLLPYVVAGSILMALVAGIFADTAVTLLYSDAFASTVPALIWLLPAFVFLSINTQFMNYFASIGMPPITVYAQALAFVINLALNLVLIDTYGIIGAAVSSVIAYGSISLVSLIYVLRRQRVT